jgi:hypothetical protein
MNKRFFICLVEHFPASPKENPGVGSTRVRTGMQDTYMINNNGDVLPLSTGTAMPSSLYNAFSTLSFDRHGSPAHHLILLLGGSGSHPTGHASQRTA